MLFRVLNNCTVPSGTPSAAHRDGLSLPPSFPSSFIRHTLQSVAISPPASPISLCFCLQLMSSSPPFSLPVSFSASSVSLGCPTVVGQTIYLPTGPPFSHPTSFFCPPPPYLCFMPLSRLPSAVSLTAGHCYPVNQSEGGSVAGCREKEGFRQS